MQLSFLDDNTQILIELDTMKKKQENMRRGLFKRFDELKNEIRRIQSELDEVKLNAGMKKEDSFEHLFKKAQ